MDPEKLFADIVAAATGAAKGHAADLRTYVEARARLIAEGVVQIGNDRLAGKITDDDVRFAFQQIKESEQTALPAIDVTLKAAAQDAINAALAVVTGAINKAIGVAIL